MGGGRKKTDPGRQGELFAASTLFPVREPAKLFDAMDVSLKIKTGLGLALKEYRERHGESAAIIAAKMSEIVGCRITEAALYSYTAPAKPDHDIGIVRLKAFIRVTGATWLWDLILADDGLTVLTGSESLLAQLGQMEQDKQQLTEQITTLRRALKARPVEVAARRGSRPADLAGKMRKGR